ncbi:hypothetical protein GOP47_0008871 [Adiantum capillus-veneris]|uniref:Uncharacterized protein n=1 Tax=Adiantum capillus-veneris TaxID=13818 RepID=A0A9D4UZP7_ADICA|nr:hypothetical protein GOP47_0008871 [Adiantum capillus-veneris]
MSVPCCSDCLGIFYSHSHPVSYAPRPTLSFPYSPCFRLSSSPLSCQSRHFVSPRSFFQEDAGPSATDNIHGKPFESSKALKSSYNRQSEEEDNVPHSRVDSGSIADGEDEHVHREDATSNDGGNVLEDGYRMIRVADKLIDIFLVERTTPEEWRKLLAFSKEWSNIRSHFFKRCRARAEQELDPQKKGNLLKLGRKLKEVDDDMERHNELFAFVKENEQNIDKVIARRRKDFTTDFFQHLELIYQASYEQPDQQNDLAKVAQKCAAAIEAHDKATEEEAAISTAQLKFEEILNSPSLDVARNKIDELAKRNELDSTLMLLITKAWATSKESSMMKEEVKDILYYLYTIARGNMQRLVPKEVRILRHVLTLEDPKEQFAALTDAFSPGAELEGKDVDLLYTTPEQLHNWIMVVLNAYYNNQKNSLMKSAQELMSPATIKRLETLKRTIEDQFL